MANRDPAGDLGLPVTSATYAPTAPGPIPYPPSPDPAEAAAGVVITQGFLDPPLEDVRAQEAARLSDAGTVVTFSVTRGLQPYWKTIDGAFDVAVCGASVGGWRYVGGNDPSSDADKAKALVASSAYFAALAGKDVGAVVKDVAANTFAYNPTGTDPTIDPATNALLTSVVATEQAGALDPAAERNVHETSIVAQQLAASGVAPDPNGTTTVVYPDNSRVLGNGVVVPAALDPAIPLVPAIGAPTALVPAAQAAPDAPKAPAPALSAAALAPSTPAPSWLKWLLGLIGLVVVIVLVKD